MLKWLLGKRPSSLEKIKLDSFMKRFLFLSVLKKMQLGIGKISDEAVNNRCNGDASMISRYKLLRLERIGDFVETKGD